VRILGKDFSMITDAERQEFSTRISQRKAKLAEISKIVKAQFVGIDKIIDAVIDNITVWYTMPELITRPIIVNLWGLTGVGKTDLVRKLVKAMKATDKFVEIQMANKSKSYDKTLQAILTNSSIEPDDPGILLLDEIQRYRTVETKGEEIHDHDFQDLWMLLSDGRFACASQAKTELLAMLLGDLYWAQEDDVDKDESKESRENRENDKRKQARRKYQQSFYSAQRMKKVLRLTEGVEEIMKWDSEKKTDLLHDALQNQTTFEGESYSKLLIFISGNLDEAYQMANSTDDADIDADVFHDFSSKINLITIKKALKKRFKPEQISRFGNVHIIYPSLDKSAYKEIIERKIQEFVDRVKQYDIQMSVDQTVKDCIYRNGVFPAQGVRPVLSTLSSTLGNSIPEFVLTALEKQETNIHICYDEKEEQLVATIDKNKYKHAIESSIDKIKRENDPENQIATAIHEAGHTIVYAVLMGYAPVQIITNASSDGTAGYVGLHQHAQTKRQILNTISILYAGVVAEEWVFGDDNKTGGCAKDLEMATLQAAQYIREYGMDGYASVVRNPSNIFVANVNYAIDDSNEPIENMLKEQKAQAQQVLTDNRQMFKALCDKLIDCETIKPEEFQAIAQAYGLNIKVESAKHVIYPTFAGKYADFKD